MLDILILLIFRYLNILIVLIFGYLNIADGGKWGHNFHAHPPDHFIALASYSWLRGLFEIVGKAKFAEQQSRAGLQIFNF